MSVASDFMICAIQEWGMPPERRIAAVQAVLDAAGWKATATCYPVFGGIWKSPCEGEDGRAATEWLQELTDKMPRGRLQDEEAHVEKMIRETLELRGTSPG